MKTLRDLDLKNKRVLMRVDFNVPLTERGEIADDLRMRSHLHSILHVLESGAKSLVLVSHFGRPKGIDEKYSLQRLVPHLEGLLSRKVYFASDILQAGALLESSESETKIILLENIRFEDGEVKNDKELSRRLARLCDVFVNDAFGSAHRAHSSTCGVAEFVNVVAAGFLIEREVATFDRVLKNPARPLVLIVGGGKVSSKLALLKNLSQADDIIIGGAMSNTFLQALGFDMKASFLESDLLETAREFLAECKSRGVGVHLPVDVVVSTNLERKEGIRSVKVGELREGESAVDIGEESVKNFCNVISGAKSIIWNGPMGVFEIAEFSKGSFDLAQCVAKSNAFSIIGGGDSASVIRACKLESEIDFISTGGGASLEYLEGKILPGIGILKC